MSESRVVIVTGGAYGIGRGIVEEFAERGDRVVIADRDSDRGAALESAMRLTSANVMFVRTDVRNESNIKDLVAMAVNSFGRIDVLCNNAGIESYKKADEYTIDDWNAIAETNLRGAFLCTKYAYPFLRQSRGCIVNISSVQAIANEPRISVYTATKAGLLGLTRSTALDFAPDGVRVNAVCPGAIRSGMMEASVKEHPNPEQAIEALGRTIPLGRVGEPEDVARVVYFLASSDAAYITGTAVVVDGGLVSRLST